MSPLNQTQVMDIKPWPNGLGFTGANIWWEHLADKDERQRLDDLMAVALLDDQVCERLLDNYDDSLLNAFGISDETKSWLRSINVNSLVELAQAIVTR
jgi:hypothetical protein